MSTERATDNHQKAEDNTFLSNKRQLKQDSKRFVSYVKRRKQEARKNLGASSLKDQHGYRQSNTLKTANILSGQF